MSSIRLQEVIYFCFIYKVKAQLEELKNQKKINEPILTQEEKASVVNEAEIKGTGFIMSMTQSDKGRTMIENQRDSRR